MGKKIIITASAEKTENSENAGSKAREDLEEILSSYNFEKKEVPLYRYQQMRHCKLKYLYKKIFSILDFLGFFLTLEKGSILFFHWPLGNVKKYSSLAVHLKKYKKLQLLCAVHDINSLRVQGHFSLEEADQLNLYDILIVHNEKMKKLCKEKGIRKAHIYVLGIFDYCMKNKEVPRHHFSPELAIAGNLSKEKAEYLTRLPEGCLIYHLYGRGYTGNETEHVCWHGAFSPDILADIIEGSFGLVWDGNNISVCSGWGEYLRYNNPHKLSLYLASGLPVIIWEEAAMADWIKNRNLGFTVKSLEQLDEKLREITSEDYEKMAANARKTGTALRQGANFRRIMEKITEELK